MLPEHYQVEKNYCIQADSSTKITKYYTWLEGPDAHQKKLYDQVVTDKDGIKLYKNNTLVSSESMKDSVLTDYSIDYNIELIGYRRPIYVPADIDTDSLLSSIYSISYSDNNNVIQFQNDSVSFIFDQENQYETIIFYDAEGYLKTEKFSAVHAINDSLAIPKAEYKRTVYSSIKGVPIEKTEYKIYINYSINSTSFLHNNEYLHLAPLVEEAEVHRYVHLTERKSISSESILVFPNPAQDRLYIRIPEKYEDTFQCSLYTPQGIEVLREDNITGLDYILNINNLPAGIYICKIQSPQLSFSKKIVIQ